MDIVDCWIVVFDRELCVRAYIKNIYMHIFNDNTGIWIDIIYPIRQNKTFNSDRICKYKNTLYVYSTYSSQRPNTA